MKVTDAEPPHPFGSAMSQVKVTVLVMLRGGGKGQVCSSVLNHDPHLHCT